MKTKLEILKEVIENGHMKVKCRNSKVLLDSITAKAILLIYENLKKQENKDGFLSWDWDRMCSFAWKRCNFNFQ